MNVGQATKALSEGCTLVQKGVECHVILFIRNGVLVKNIDGTAYINDVPVEDLQFVSKEEELGQMRLKLEG